MHRVILLLALLCVLAACDGDAKTTVPIEDIPTDGDAAQGEILFAQATNGTPACSSCHQEGAAAAPYITTGYGDLAADRVEGESAYAYTFYAITEPARHIVDGYGNAMYNQYDEKLSEQQIADLIAYMLGL